LQYCNVQSAKIVYYVADGLRSLATFFVHILCTFLMMIDDDDE